MIVITSDSRLFYVLFVASMGNAVQYSSNSYIYLKQFSAFIEDIFGHVNCKFR